MEDALYEITSMRLFAGLSLDSAIPDHTTIMNFRHLLEKHKLSRQLFQEVNKWLSSAGVYLKEATIVDATIIETASSTKNKAKARDPEMHQTQKGKQWFFGLKAHIGVDARAGLTHSLSTTAANVHDITETEHLLHGEETFISGDSGYRGAQKRSELKDIKASIRAKVEHPFPIIKRQFGFRKVIYRGLEKNDNKLSMLFALANVFKIDQMIRAARG